MQGYQIVVVCAQNAVILFKDALYNQSPHKIQLVKTDGHFDGLTSIPAFIKGSYLCFDCNRGYDHENNAHHNCQGQTVQLVYGKTRSAQTMLLG